jgi:hypothetical protein
MFNTPEEQPHCYGVAGLAIQLEAGVSLKDFSFLPQIERFRIPNLPAASSENAVLLRHHFAMPELSSFKLEEKIYSRAPWEIYRASSSWVYVGKYLDGTDYIIAVFNETHTTADIYHRGLERFLKKDLESLSLFPTDQVWLARLLADRQAFYLHASGVIINGQGLAFVGHSEAGKTTITHQVNEIGKVLCDDRIILRRWPEGFKVHGTWSHGELHQVSQGSARLRAVLVLEQAPENRLMRLEPGEAVRALPQFVIKPLVTRDWWEKVLDTIGHLAREVPVYRLRFDKSGRICEMLLELL